MFAQLSETIWQMLLKCDIVITNTINEHIKYFISEKLKDSCKIGDKCYKTSVNDFKLVFWFNNQSVQTVFNLLVYSMHVNGHAVIVLS